MRYVQLMCPENDCDWNSGDYEIQYMDDVQEAYVTHWKRSHVPDPPDPTADFWSD